ncbi:MAG: RluA family pseudouridine synthase [bacterium]
MSDIYRLIVTPSTSKQRLDIFLVQQGINNLSRSQIRKLILSGHVRVNECSISKPNYLVKKTDTIVVDVPPPEPLKVQPEDISLDIIYEDEYLIVINKPPGLVVHPAVGNYSHTLVNALLFHCKNLTGIGGVLRPGIVHRLDKDTSGVIVTAKTDQAHQRLSNQFKNRTVEKAYMALVYGIVKQDRGTIETPFGRDKIDRKKMSIKPKGKIREAVTLFEITKRFMDTTLLSISIKTGRTHQIRVHMKYIGHPIIGDDLYGGSAWKNSVDYNILKELNRQALHASSLSFNHPISGERLTFITPFPTDIQEVIDKLSTDIK